MELEYKSAAVTGGAVAFTPALRLIYPPAGEARGSLEQDLRGLRSAAVPAFCPSSPSRKKREHLQIFRRVTGFVDLLQL